MVKTKTKIEKQSWKKGNPILVETIRAAKKAGSPLWLRVAGILAGPRRNKIETNLGDIEAMTSEGDSVVVPGKVLSQGEISKKIAVIAFNFSEKSREKLLKTKSQALSILEEIKKNPEAKGLRILPEQEKEK
ncbi:MAG: 50S ribosomal protein L18e [Candidatus Pacearchaeota archaeon]|nr:50S ribosomal protein L18e [Nanoarchaeota archaeon]MDZ4226606.1 50S ribosomal protein L18e [Candidatus Pacearchaeota archaeon]